MREKNCSSPSFKALLLTQFLGSLNENAHRVLITLLVVNTIMQESGGITQLVLVNILVFLPFVLFSPLSGYLADRFSKATIIRRSKLLELAVMALTMVLLLRQDVLSLLAVMFLVGCTNTLISPCKYGIIPEIIPQSQLSRGNGLLQFWSFLAIITGTALGGTLAGVFEDAAELPGLVMVVVAICGIVAAERIETTAPGDRHKKLEISHRSSLAALKEISNNRQLYLSILGIVYFWSVGAMFQLNTVLYAKEYAHFSDVGSSLLLAALALGLGVGGLAAGAASDNKLELGLVPLGTVGLSFFSIGLGLAPMSYPVAFFLLLLAGISGGFFCVPLYAHVQERSPVEQRGSYWGATNLLVFSGMIGSSLLLIIMVDVFGLAPNTIFLLIGLSALGMAVYICSMLPAVLVRCINWIFVQSIFRLEVHNRENVPSEGAAIIVCNRCSAIDTALISASLERSVVFLVAGASSKRIASERGKTRVRNWTKSPAIRQLLSNFGVIPVSGLNPGAGQLDAAAMRLARSILHRGGLLCVLAEDGLETIGGAIELDRLLAELSGTTSPKADMLKIIPTYLDQMWGGVVSQRHRRFSFQLPLVVPYPVTVSFGEHVQLDSETKAAETSVKKRLDTAQIVEKLEHLAASTIAKRSDLFQQLERGFIAGCKRAPFARAVIGPRGQTISRNRLLMQALLLAEQLGRDYESETRIGVAVDAAGHLLLASAAILISGKIPVYISGELAKGGKKQSNEPSVIIYSTREQLAGSGQHGLSIDQLQESSGETWAERLRAPFYYFAALLLPQHLIEQLFLEPRRLTDSAAEIGNLQNGFTKLSDREISAWCFMIYRECRISGKDRVLLECSQIDAISVVAGIWLPLLCGVSVIHSSVEATYRETLAQVGKRRASLLVLNSECLEQLKEEPSSAFAGQKQRSWIFSNNEKFLTDHCFEAVAGITLYGLDQRGQDVPWIR